MLAVSVSSYYSTVSGVFNVCRACSDLSPEVLTLAGVREQLFLVIVKYKMFDEMVKEFAEEGMKFENNMTIEL